MRTSHEEETCMEHESKRRTIVQAYTREYRDWNATFGAGIPYLGLASPVL
jgi:hypothetical protein